MDEAPIRIPLGYDLIRAEVIAAACTDSGYQVRLLRNEHPETGSLVALQPSYLLVHAADEAAVQEIVERTYPSD